MNTTKNSSQSSSSFLPHFFIFLLKFFTVVTLPFILLIRGAIYLYLELRMDTWIALSFSILGTSLLLVLYAVLLNTKLSGKFKENTRSLRKKLVFVFLLIIGYCTYTLVFFSDSNAKTSEVKAEFSSLHPFLRLGVGTLVFLDSDLLVTDFSRERADYQKMGLRTKNNSMHYIQSDGYAHALDLRTNGRSEMRNSLLEFYFQLMGFGTLRHVGTADHLHISVATHENPKAL